jgi:hypothetical protein
MGDTPAPERQERPQATGVSADSVSSVSMAGPSMPTLAEIRATWPATVDVPMAGRVFGLSRSHAYELVSRKEFLAKVHRWEAGDRGPRGRNLIAYYRFLAGLNERVTEGVEGRVD